MAEHFGGVDEVERLLPLATPGDLAVRILIAASADVEHRASVPRERWKLGSDVIEHRALEAMAKGIRS
ncbi:MAG: hypothetical protein IPG91_05620 [Ideonella sp.]|nr:hypothetical protein [Ideonella sp.]